LFVGSETGIISATGTPVGVIVGSSVGGCVGWRIGFGVGTDFGAGIISKIGAPLGKMVGFSIGEIVGDRTGFGAGMISMKGVPVGSSIIDDGVGLTGRLVGLERGAGIISATGDNVG
jgi:hypothetical protein